MGGSTRQRNGEEKEGRMERERGENSAEENAVKKSSFLNVVSNNQGCIYSITKGIVYFIQRQRVECIINKMCMHNEAVRKFFRNFS